MKRRPWGDSLLNALSGLQLLFRRERNAKIEGLFALLGLGLCAWFKVPPAQWAWVLLCITGVLSAEALNSALEALADTVHPKRHPGIAVAKDLAAAAVLLWALLALVAGVLIFGPYLRLM